MRTLAGNKKWIPGGEEGESGRPGKVGRSGVKGQYVLERDLNRRLDELLLQQKMAAPKAAATQSPASNSEDNNLEKTLLEILKRLDALEKRGR